MQKTSARPRKLLALSLALVLFSIVPASTQAAPTPILQEVFLSTGDPDHDGLFDFLNITVRIQAPQDGGYLVVATLRWPATGTTVASVSSPTILDTSVTFYPLQIDGATISEKQLDGPYNLTVELISSPSGPIHDMATFVTGPYTAASFEASGPRDKPHLEVGPESVQLKSPSINASVNRTRPAVQWGPAFEPDGTPASPAFEATFPRVVAFADDGDHAFETAEEVCAADLTSGNWTITALEIGPSAEFGGYIRFTLESAVSFEGASCAPGIGGTLGLTFLITQRNGTVAGSTPVAILGGLEVKVDMALTLQAAVIASDLAFEVDLRDLRGSTHFLVRGPQGFEALDPHGAALPVEPLAPGQPADVERVSFVDSGGAAVGHFAWLALAAENLTGGAERFVQVTASRGTGGGSMQVYLAAPNDAQLRRLTLDPVVGVPEQAQQPGGGVPPPPPPEPRPSLLVFAAALAAVSAMFFFSVYARAKKY